MMSIPTDSLDQHALRDLVFGLALLFWLVLICVLMPHVPWWVTPAPGFIGGWLSSAGLRGVVQWRRAAS